MGAPAAWPGDRPCLGAGLRGLSGCAQDPGRLDRPPAGPWCAGRAARRDRLVDGVVRSARRNGRCGLLPAGNASGYRLRHPWPDRLVCAVAGPDRGAVAASPARARGASVWPVHRADAFRLPANPAGRAGRGHRRGPRLPDLARHEWPVLPRRCLLCARTAALGGVL
ncbi:UNVERIFIED_CONTAM: hypothetical protein NCL1_00634 [Trichonephila clavipes]